MNVAAQIAAARAQAFELLTDAVSIGAPSRVDDGSRYGAPKLTYTARTNTPSAALVQAASAYAGGSSSPDRDVSLTEYVVKLAVGTVVEPGDRIVPVSCVLYPQLVGAQLTVLRVEASSVAVLQRVICQRSVPTKDRP